MAAVWSFCFVGAYSSSSEACRKRMHASLSNASKSMFFCKIFRTGRKQYVLFRLISAKNVATKCSHHPQKISLSDFLHRCFMKFRPTSFPCLRSLSNRIFLFPFKNLESFQSDLIRMLCSEFEHSY